MTKEAKQYISDTLALEALEARQSLWTLHPDASLGGDGPWNNYGDEHGEPEQYIPPPWKPQLTGDEWLF
jgi:hypothetical protein